VQISTNICLSDCSLICVEAPYSTLGADQRAAVAAILPWVKKVPLQMVAWSRSWILTEPVGARLAVARPKCAVSLVWKATRRYAGLTPRVT
jgi:hypothetical protein